MRYAELARKAFLMTLPFVGLFVFLFFPRHGQDKLMDEYKRSLDWSNSSYQILRYRATYTYRENGHDTVMEFYVPPRNPDMPPDFYGTDTIEEQIYEAIERAAQERAITLPENYKDDVLIATIVGN